MAGKGYAMVSRPGVTVVLLNRGRILLLKRISLPFISHPGIWYFVGGARKGRESPLQNAYREVEEEVGITKDELKPLSRSKIVVIDRGKGWENDSIHHGSQE